MPKFLVHTLTAWLLCFLTVNSLLHAADTPLYVKVRLPESLKISALKPGDVVTGQLAQDVYHGESEVFPSGSVVRLTVDALAKRRRVPNDHWPWIVKLFTPRHETYPTFQKATVVRPDNAQVPLNVSLIFLNREVEVRAQQKKDDNGSGNVSSKTDNQGAPMLVLEGRLAQDATPDAAPASAGSVTLPTGTSAKVVLLGPLSAGKSHPGDTFQARVIEPIRQGDEIVVPEGTVLTGEVSKSKAPRMLSRAGSLYLKFTGLNLAGMQPAPLSASVAGAELDRNSHTYVDAEGGLKGAHPGKAWMAINLGMTFGLGKVADDTLQLLIEAAVSSATDASTAGAGRIAAACVGGVFLITRHGRDVVLPRYTQMDIVFDRSTNLGH